MSGKVNLDIVVLLRTADGFDLVSETMNEAADEIERLREALEELLCEAEDIFVCMADATGIDRHNFPLPFYKARTALGEKE